MFENTQLELRHYVSNAVGDLISGQCGTTGADTSNIYAAFLWQPDDYFNDHFYEVYVYAGTNKGVTKRVTDWVLSTYLLTVHSVYGAACDASSFIELHRIFTKDDYDKAISLAIESIKESYLMPAIDVTTTLVDDIYEYSLPVGFAYVHRITTEDEAGGGVFENGAVIDTRDWSLISGRKLKLDESAYSVEAGYDLRIEGYKVQPVLTGDEDVCYLPTGYIVNKAITFLPQGKIQANELNKTYERALVMSSRIPSNPPDPTSRKVLE